MSISNGMSSSSLISGFLTFSSETTVTVFLLCVACSEGGPVSWGTGSPGRGTGSRVPPVLFPVTLPDPHRHVYPAESPTPERKPPVVQECWMVATVALTAPRLPHRPFSLAQLSSPASHPRPVEPLCTALLFLECGVNSWLPRSALLEAVISLSLLCSSFTSCSPASQFPGVH